MFRQVMSATADSQPKLPREMELPYERTRPLGLVRQACVALAAGFVPPRRRPQKTPPRTGRSHAPSRPRRAGMSELSSSTSIATEKRNEPRLDQRPLVDIAASVGVARRGASSCASSGLGRRRAGGVGLERSTPYTRSRRLNSTALAAAELDLLRPRLQRSPLVAGVFEHGDIRLGRLELEEVGR
jgi:hypothetical protein